MLRIRASNWETKDFKELGRGGEAIVYRIKPTTVAKIFLLPNAPEFADSPEAQAGAKVRIQEMQTKLYDFPSDLPAGVIAPTGVLLNGKDQVFGYIMPFVKGTALDKMTRTSVQTTGKSLGKLIAGLYELVEALHERGVVIGDFNENNILVYEEVPYLIDADSMQFGRYQAKSFMPRFVAPELIKALPTAKPQRQRAPARDSWDPLAPQRPPPPMKQSPLTPMFSMVAPHTPLTDWYSFLVIVMRLLTFTDPYGGVMPRMEFVERMEKRITLFDNRVVYPRIARPLKNVPRPILEMLFNAFHLGERFVPDKKVFMSLDESKRPTNKKQEKEAVDEPAA